MCATQSWFVKSGPWVFMTNILFMFETNSDSTYSYARWQHGISQKGYSPRRNYLSAIGKYCSEWTWPLGRKPMARASACAEIRCSNQQEWQWKQRRRLSCDEENRIERDVHCQICGWFSYLLQNQNACRQARKSRMTQWLMKRLKLECFGRKDKDY